MFKNLKFGFGIYLLFGICILGFTSLAVGCGSSGTTSAATTTTTAASGTTTTTTSTTSTTVAGSTATISGQVAVSASDVSALGLSVLSCSEPVFRTLASSGLSGASATLYQIAADGTETDTNITATTDASGDYTLNNVPVLSSGVYKAVASKSGSSATVAVSSLVALTTTASKTANIAPESSIAVAMYDDVIKDEFSSLIVNANTMDEISNLVVDDTETDFDQAAGGGEAVGSISVSTNF